MTHEEIARAYIKGLRAGDGQAIGALFAPTAVLEDFLGGRRVGRSQIAAAVGGRREGMIVEAPLNLIAEEHWVTVYGRVTIPGWDEVAKLRWSFTLSDGQIVRLVNSQVQTLYGVEG